ncbi:hypothetical protein [Streptomyces sp. S.PB5]|uniref:hypothetical protein n=1 Tax=Streptomyces sp. S.PB5 TaxID=3020844 RepID=UPI0025B1EACC|nr:hypothetical protein [Streptomyces sp. S.PB5]MDN3025184.1 hypothetical protein [Streptomyces sp. S.PB5]
MTTDPGEPEPSGPEPRFELPRVLQVTARRVRHAWRRPRNFDSELPAEGEVAEFLVETDAAVPTRALGPVLHVGETVLLESAAVDPTHYRFLGPDPERLRPGTPISLGWSGQEDAERATPFRFAGWDAERTVSRADD